MFVAIFCPEGDASLLLGVQGGWKGFSCCCCSAIASGARWLFGSSFSTSCSCCFSFILKFPFWLVLLLLQHCNPLVYIPIWKKATWRRRRRIEEGGEGEKGRGKQEHAVAWDGWASAKSEALVVIQPLLLCFSLTALGLLSTNHLSA